MEAVYTNTCEMMGCTLELSEFQGGIVLGSHLQQVSDFIP